MEQTYSYSTWLFTRILCLIYIIAFISLIYQADGLWGSEGIAPIREYLASVEKNVDSTRYLKAPAIFWLSTSNDMIVGVTITGAVAAGLALLGFAQGWCLLLCFFMYLSLCSFGQEFMSFQWDALLLEIGFLSLFVVPWNFDFTLSKAKEPHGIVRGMFYIVLFKLMFQSGFVKLWSGDESWRDLSALNYHFWTQPIPNPLAPFAHALPEIVHQISTVLMFAIELIVPFFIFARRTRIWAAVIFIAFSVAINLSGNFTFFNWLTIAICLWAIPDTVWDHVFSRLPFKLDLVTAPMFPHPTSMVAMGVLACLSFFWCVRFAIPDVALEAISPAISYVQAFKVSNPYGLFAVMTTERKEIVIEGSLDGQVWKEYEFKYKPGNIYRQPPTIAPFQPRLDWQMWFAALGTIQDNPWLGNLMLRLFQNSATVTGLFESNPFGDTPPKYLRSKVYSYEFATVNEIVDSGQWWKRTLSGDYSPTFVAPETQTVRLPSSSHSVIPQ